MAAVRFTGGFTDHRGVEWDLEIYDSEFSGTATAFTSGADGFRLKYESVNDAPTSPLAASRLTFPMLIQDDDTETFITDLLESAEDRFTVRVLRDGVFFWCGYILTDISRMEDQYYPYEFSVSAVCGLSRLKGLEYKNEVDVGEFEPYDALSFVLHTIYALTKEETLATRYWGGSDIFLRTSVDWYHSEHGAAIAATDPLFLSRFSGQIFAERQSSGEMKYKSCWDVLTEILTVWKARLYFSAGAWHFEQPDYRLNNNFFERRYSKTGSQLSTATVNYDRSIVQDSTGAKMNGVSYDWFPPLKRVEVTYDHRTLKNWLAGYGNSWSDAAGFELSQTLELDSNLYFKLSGRVRATITTTSATPAPWYYKFKCLVQIGTGLSAWMVRRRATVSVPATGVLKYDDAEWDQNDGFNIELPTPFVWGPTWDGYFDFVLYTPIIPATASGDVVFNFFSVGAYDWSDNSLSVASLDWQTEWLELLPVNSTAESNRERIREHIVENPANNSEVVKITTRIGDAIKPWTPGKITTSADGITWADTSYGWKVHAAGASSMQFSELLARATMAAQAVPQQRMHGTVYGDDFYFHSLSSDLDSRKWLMLGGELNGNLSEWTGEWWGVSYAAGTGTHTHWSVYDFPEIPQPSGDEAFTQRATNDPQKVILAALVTAKTSAALTGGSSTSATVSAAMSAGTFVSGDTVLILNPMTWLCEQATVATTNAAGATSVAFTAAVTNDFPPHVFLIKRLSNAPAADTSGFHKTGDAFGADATLGLTDNFDLYFKTNNTVRGYLDQGGNWAFGYTSGATPGQRVTVNGAVLAANNYGFYHLLAGGTTNETLTMNTSDEVTLKTPSSKAMYFQRGGTTLAQFQSTGAEFEVLGDLHADALLLDNGSTDATAGRVQYHDDLSNFEHLGFGNGSVEWAVGAMSSGVIQCLDYATAWTVTTTLGKFFGVTARYDGLRLRRVIVSNGGSYGSGTGNNTFRVNLNGTSLGTLNINSAPGNLSTNSQVFAGDKITFDITAIKNTTAAQGLTVELIFSR